MSLGEVDAKFPNQSNSGIAPPATPQNPGQVYPKSDPNAAASATPISGASEPLGIENQRVFQSNLDRLDDSLSGVIATIEDEATSMGNHQREYELLLKFKGWRRELDGIRTSHSNVGIDHSRGVPAEKGGLFVD